MSTLYWINTLGNLSDALCFSFAILAFISIFLVMYRLIGIDDDNKDEIKKWNRISKITIICFIVIGIICVFVPSKRDLYIIYGVGGTVDYLKSNEAAKHLPDKYIKILDKWADEQLNDANKEK